MDIYVIMQVIILFGAIFLGVRLGGMGIGYAGGLGVVLLSLGMGTVSYTHLVHTWFQQGIQTKSVSSRGIQRRSDICFQQEY